MSSYMKAHKRQEGAITIVQQTFAFLSLHLRRWAITKRARFTQNLFWIIFLLQIDQKQHVIFSVSCQEINKYNGLYHLAAYLV